MFTDFFFNGLAKSPKAYHVKAIITFPFVYDFRSFLLLSLPSFSNFHALLRYERL